MIVRLFWRDYAGRPRKLGPDPIDAFWVEATLDEAEAAIYPRLTPEVVAESKELAEKLASLARSLDRNAYCFLVARDVSSIEPRVVHHPFHQLWNGYSPFEEMPERQISRLDELASIVLPAKGSERG